MAATTTTFSTKDISRFQEKVEIVESGCHIWTKAKSKDGYGAFKLNGKRVQTHRAWYQHQKGEIPAGLELDHLCYNPACCNPEHLEPVTKEVNLSRRRRYAAAHREVAEVLREGALAAK